MPAPPTSARAASTTIKEGSIISYYSERMEEVIVGEQGDLTQGEKALLEYPRGSSGASWRRQLERKGGSPLNAKTVLRLLSNPKMRRVVIRLLKSPTVRQIIISQVKRRMRHR